MRPRPDDRVTIVVDDGLRTFEFGIAVELFALERPELPRWYDTVVASVADGPVRATGGVEVAAAARLEEVADAGTLVVPGWPTDDRPLPPIVRDALRSCVARGGRVVGICSGTFALAAAGLLDGRRATTHWSYADMLATRHPRVDVDVDALYVDEHEVLTSAGSAAGIDAGLHLVREDWGAEVAAVVARRLVMAPHRDGGQRQFAVRPAHGRGGADRWLATLQEWVVDNLDQPLSVGVLAERAAMSPRTLRRRFAVELGESPSAWLTRQRVERALELLAGSDLPVDRVAHRVGFGSAAALRHHVRGRLGTTPTAYRRRFSPSQARA